MNKDQHITLNSVREFHETFSHPVKSEPTVPSERLALRMSLIFEELSEFAEAAGKIGTFSEIIKTYLEKNDGVKDTNEADIVGMGDALVDLDYVWSGTVLECGMGDIYCDMLHEVHGSNMSKACDTEIEAVASVEHYKTKGIHSTYRKVGAKYVLYREDGKILKRPGYREADLKRFFRNAEKEKTNSQ
jgi:predicted HAD superfamily Cof-like phosphohydrolase